MKAYLSLIVLLLSLFPYLAQDNKSAKSPDIPTVTFCDLIQNPDLYDGKEVRFRAKYISTFEVAAFVDANCSSKENQTWAEFDGLSIKASLKPEIYQKVKKQIFCCMFGGDNYFRGTEMLVTGIFHGKNKGYGHLGEYRFMVTVKNVEEISETEKTKRPGFDPQ